MFLAAVSFEKLKKMGCNIAEGFFAHGACEWESLGAGYYIAMDHRPDNSLDFTEFSQLEACYVVIAGFSQYKALVEKFGVIEQEIGDRDLRIQYRKNALPRLTVVDEYETVFEAGTEVYFR